MAGKKKQNRKKRQSCPTVKTVNTMISKALQSQKNVELGRNRSAYSATLVAGASAFLNTLYGLGQGIADLANRKGDRINMKKLRVSGNCKWSGTGVDAIRVVIYIWNEDIGANAPNESQLFDDTANSIAKVYGDINYDCVFPRGKRFSILYDKSFTLSDSDNSVSFTKSISLRNKQAQATAGQSFTVAGVGIPYITYVSTGTTIVNTYMTVEYSDL